MLTRQIEKAQRKVESHNFDIRKQLLLFDDVANDQRKVIYQQRTEIMGTADLSAAIRGHPRGGGRRADRSVPAQAAMPAGLGPGGPAARRCETRFQRARGPAGLARSRSRSSRSRRCARGSLAGVQRGLRDQGGAHRRGDHAPHREGRHAAHARSALARAPGGDGLPAPGHPPARLRAEGLPLRVQARGFRAVRGDARSREVRDGVTPDRRSRCAPRRRSSAKRRSAASV